MDKEFQLYREYCLKNGLKECRFESLQAYYKDKNKKTAFENFKKSNVLINVVLPMTNQDRLKAIEDYYIWADEKKYDLECVATFIEYQKYLKELKK